MLITIDKTKELTRKEYVDFVRKVKGETLSEGRISQLVSAGKLQVRDYPELNNLQLIVLNDGEQALAQARFTTSQAIHTYSYKELGLMVGKLIHDLTIENGNAQTLLSEKQTQIEGLVTQLGQVEAEGDQARQTHQTLEGEYAQLQVEHQKLRQTLTERDEQRGRDEAEIHRLGEALADTQRKLAVETSFRSEFEEFKTLVMTMLQNQPKPPVEGVEGETKGRKRTKKQAS